MLFGIQGLGFGCQSLGLGSQGSGFRAAFSGRGRNVKLLRKVISVLVKPSSVDGYLEEGGYKKMVREPITVCPLN